MAKKLDNSDSTAKLALRRYLLEKYHGDDPPDVLDCCQGGGVLWKTLRREFQVRTYWGVDLKPKKGRLKLDSVRILQQPGWPQNVIDIDTYGSPWKHWVALLPDVTQATTVFLTVGLACSGGLAGRFGAMSSPQCLFDCLGLRFSSELPRGINTRIGKYAVQWMLGTAAERLDVVEAIESESAGHARYIGVHLKPKKESSSVCETEPPQHSRADKEPEHV